MPESKSGRVQKFKNEQTNKMEPDNFDKQSFECCKCRKKFTHDQGTWLPLSEVSKEWKERIEEFELINISNLMQQPEKVTSLHFTCYDCCE